MQNAGKRVENHVINLEHQEREELEENTSLGPLFPLLGRTAIYDLFAMYFHLTLRPHVKCENTWFPCMKHCCDKERRGEEIW